MGRPIKYNDAGHKILRENQRKYYVKNREAILYANRNRVTVAEARNMLKKEKECLK